MTKPTIYLDMDGVLVDFVSGAIEATGIDLTHDTWTEWDAYRLKGWTSDQFWAPINERLYFWEDLQPYPWAEELLELCKGFGEVVFCSTPSRNPESASGKLAWLQQRGWLKNHDCILMKDKWRLAKPGTILIDDRQESCDLFSKRGKTICFPQPWNVHRWTRDSQDRLRAVRLLLNYLETENRQFVESRNRFFHEVSQLGKQVTEYKDNNLILGIRVENLQVELEKLRTENDVLRGQVKNQAATIKDYQVGKKSLQASIDTLQSNASGWSRLFAIIEHQMETYRETADRLRREIDATPTEVQDSDAPRSGRVEASDFLDSIKPGDSLRIIDKAKVYFGHAKEWFTVREVNYEYHPNIPRFRVDGPKGDWHPFWFGLTDSDGLYLLTGAKERVNVATVQSPPATGAGSAPQASDSAGGSAGGTAKADIG